MIQIFFNTYEISSLASEIINLSEIHKFVNNRWECVWRIWNNMYLSKNYKLDHKTGINRSIE
jgi:hypothetical protein